MPGPPVALPPEPLPPRPTPAPPPPSAQPQNLPYPTLGTLFKGRDAELAAIRAGFLTRPGQPQAVGPRHAVHGTGGIGKTRLAVEYAWRRADRRVQGWHDAWLMNYPRPLAVTWQTSAETLPGVARALLDVIAWFGDEALPRFLFCEGGDESDEKVRSRIALRASALRPLLADPAEAEEDQPLDEALARLGDLSLLQGAAAEFDSPGRLHRVLGLMIRAAQTPERATAARAAARAFADVAAVGDPMDIRDWPVWLPLEPHLRALLAEGGDGAPGVESRLLSDLGTLLYARARYAEAEPLMRRALAIDEQGLGPEHPGVARNLNNLAALLQATNRLAEAEPLMRRALAIMLRSSTATGHRLPNLDLFHANYAQLLAAQGLDAAATAARLAGVCAEAGGDPGLL